MYYDVISLFSNMDIFSANRHSESKVLCQNRDKEPLCEPGTSFILRTRTNSDVSHCGVETGSDHGESIFTAGTSLRLLDVWWRRLISHWKDYKCKSVRLICMCLSWSGHLRLYMNKRNETGGEETNTGKCKLPPTLPFATDWCWENMLIKAGGRKLYQPNRQSEVRWCIKYVCSVDGLTSLYIKTRHRGYTFE